MKKISLLGSTGSIGVSTLDVIGANQSEFSVAALTAGRNITLLKEQIDRFRPRLVAVADEEHAFALKEMLTEDHVPAIVFGGEGLREAATMKEAHMVVSAMVGAAGLLPTLAAVDAGKDIALANKETLVMAGGIIVKRAKEKGVSIIPVDSEHSAVFQCLQGHRKEDVKRIILTASGGPFLRASESELARVTPADALRHPNWSMGKKITIDSATMMNKALEVIEARWLFDLPFSRIEVLIHPQSIVHSLVEYLDGGMIAQLGVPDMRGPIAYALSYPRRLVSRAQSLDLCTAGSLEFIVPDRDRFPAIELAYEAGLKGGTAPAVMNAANEEAVAAFLGGEIRFTDIVKVTTAVVRGHQIVESPGIDEVLAADSWARDEARRLIRGMMKC